MLAINPISLSTNNKKNVNFKAIKLADSNQLYELRKVANLLESNTYTFQGAQLTSRLTKLTRQEAYELTNEYSNVYLLNEDLKAIESAKNPLEKARELAENAREFTKETFNEIQSFAVSKLSLPTN